MTLAEKCPLEFALLASVLGEPASFRACLGGPAAVWGHAIKDVDNVLILARLDKRLVPPAEPWLLRESGYSVGCHISWETLWARVTDPAWRRVNGFAEIAL